MKFGATILVIVALAGCSSESVPSTPTGPPPPLVVPPAPPGGSPGSRAALGDGVRTDGGLGRCIPGATIQVVSETGDLGEPITQTPCSYWDYGGGVELKGLTPGVSVKLRASASGFTPREQTFMPCVGGCAFQFIELTAKRTE